tara:strand:+ start:455 stop:622 length:168 start_codon:yes stop_codon:yes gene_type:complete
MIYYQLIGMMMTIGYGSGVGAATEQVNGVVCKTIEAGGGTLVALQNLNYEDIKVR